MSLMFLLSIHSCRMRTYLDPVSRVIVLHPPVCLWCRPHLTRPPPRRLLFPQQRDLFFGHHPGETADQMNGAFNWFLSTSRSVLGQDGDHRPEAGVLWCTCDFVVSKKGLMIERIPSDVNFWTLYLIPKLLFFFFFYWQYEAWSEWPLLPRPLILLPEAFWSENASLQTMYSLTLLFFCFFHHQLCPAIPFKFNHFILYPPPPPRPTSSISLSSIHVFIYCVYVCVSMCRPNRH